MSTSATSTRQTYVWLDLVRGLSAVAVCAGHLRASLFVDNGEVVASSLWQQAFYFMTGLGHQAVMVFFVLSGLFVGGSVLRSGARFQPRQYAVARLSRLWIVLIPALLFTALVDLAIRMLAPQVLDGAYGATWNSGPGVAGTYSVSLATLLGNILFLQTISVPVFGSNSPLWSLANEFWYYVLFPLCAMAFGFIGARQPGQWLWRLLSASMAVLILAWLPLPIALAYLIWLLGLVVYVFVDKVHTPGARRLLVAAGLLAFGASLVYSKAAGLQARVGLPSDAVIGLAFCLLCVGLANLPSPRNTQALWVRMSQGLSAFSYSLYLVHFPLVALIGGAVYGGQRVQPSASMVMQYTLWLALLLAVGIVFWWLFERRTDVLRKALAQLVRLPAPTPRAPR